MKQAYWLASYPKSGNTWVRLLLSAYSLGALDINSTAHPDLHDGDQYLNNALAPFPLNQMPKEAMLYLRHAVLLHLIASRRKDPCIIKTHNVHGIVGDVNMFPVGLTAGAVYIVRDPRDVVSSLSKHLGKTVDQTIAHMGESKATIEDSKTGISGWLNTWSMHVTSWLHEGVTVVRYEDMLEDTEKELERILNAFNIKVDRRRVKKAVNLCELSRLKKQEEKEGFIEKKKQGRFFGGGRGWEKELTEKQARRIEEDHKEVMKELKYI